MEPYEKLSKIYDGYWGKFSNKYYEFLIEKADEFNLKFDSILDLACGTGNLINKLAEKAETIIGLDYSSHMLNIAREKFKDNDNIKFTFGDFRNFSFDKNFDLILCCFDSLNYVQNKNEVMDVLKCVEKNLKHNGKFIFDIVNEKHFLKTNGMSGEYTISEVTYKNKCKYSENEKVAHNIFIFEDGKEIHRQIPIEYEDIKDYIRKLNLEIVETFNSLDGTNIKDNPSRYYFILKRS